MAIIVNMCLPLHYQESMEFSEHLNYFRSLPLEKQNQILSDMDLSNKDKELLKSCVESTQSSGKCPFTDESKMYNCVAQAQSHYQ